MMNRRSAMITIANSATVVLSPSLLLAGRHVASTRTGLGLVVYCCRQRRDHLLASNADFDLFEASNFLKHCAELGAGGAQVSLGVLDAVPATKLRAYCDANDLYLEAIVRAPTESKQLERFESEVITAARSGAKAIRTTIIPGRRYEFFKSMQQFEEYDARARRALELAAPIVEKHQIPLAVENHKDHRDAQRIALLEHISSEYVGACLDTGNSFALLEDPIETVRDLAPWAHSVHLKDQALQRYDDGFLLADIPLGQGSLDLQEMVKIIRAVKPDARFSLELITRDPLEVPVFAESYWPTLQQVPAVDLARTMRIVRDGEISELQYPSQMSAAERLALEDQNVRASLDYARDTLEL